MEPRSKNNVVTLKEFQAFKDKNSAINVQTGASEQLSSMTKRWHNPGQTLAVGNVEYKKIIEAEMGIYCLFNDAVMEVMWGLKNLVKSIVPNEKSDLASEDQPKMCQGMKILLDRHGIDVKAEMVNGCIVEMAWCVYTCDFCVNKHANFLHRGGQCLLKVSGIDTQNWDFLELATALRLVCYPEEGIKPGNSPVMLSADEARKLLGHAQEYKHKYNYMLNKDACLSVYKEIVRARDVRTRALKLLHALVKEARKDYMKSPGSLGEVRNCLIGEAREVSGSLKVAPSSVQQGAR